jgi:hypothetical protein
LSLTVIKVETRAIDFELFFQQDWHEFTSLVPSPLKKHTHRATKTENGGTE